MPGVTAPPNVTWGGRIVGQPTPALSLSAGAFYSDPTLNQLTANGTEFGISSAAGYFVIGEVGYSVHAENNAPGDEDALKICDNADDVSKARPGAFVTGAGSGQVLITFKRVKR